MNIREARKKNGLTQAELSKRTGIHRITISRYENGASGMNTKNAVKLAEALRCPVYDLMKGLKANEKKNGRQ